ncbi:RNA polymerase sigma factor [Planctomicrobium piriforme]|uniref:RNA polymerase sigma factor n=1 Tax=Planctomicrobium piriforme TaxID=1576369 RepID=A0A1I3GQH4_9PLAN|nr:RNA polymerase sigma factor [Planctomicrobium piriforme]SFI25591.1 RNA polymerase sigma-70 factor, ECF subfamily [Planctomicrobium piriforme]
MVGVERVSARGEFRILAVMESDADIMRRVQAGEVQLFELLVSRYHVRLLRFAISKLHDQPSAEDVVQETFLAAYQARQSYSDRFAFSTWIWTILLNLSRRSLKQQSRRQGILRDYVAAQHVEAGSMPFPLSLERAEERERLQRWLDQLSEEESDAIRLRFYGGLKFEEVALAMNSSVNGAKMRVRRGLLKLAELARTEE